MHFKREDPILTFDQFWRVTGLTKSQVQNWTNGRPFKVRGSIADASGKGSRNLYTLGDAYLFVFLEQLRKSHLSHNGLREVLDLFEKVRLHPLAGEKDLFDPIYGWLVVGLAGGTSITPVEKTNWPSPMRNLPSLAVNDSSDRVGRQFSVNIAKIRDEVDARWKKLSSQKRSRKTPHD